MIDFEAILTTAACLLYEGAFLPNDWTGLVSSGLPNAVYMRYLRSYLRIENGVRLPMILGQSFYLEASNPRDKVYGTLGLMGHPERTVNFEAGLLQAMARSLYLRDEGSSFRAV